MKVCILMGSPRIQGNTAELLKPFIATLESNGCDIAYIPLFEKKILPCKGCYACQQVAGSYGCVQDDDAGAIMATVIESDCVVLATPIHTWYCTAPMKALLDRHYGLNKFYGKTKGSLWAGKRLAIIATHGYDAKYGAEPFEMGVRRLCEHSKLKYMGMYSVRDEEDIVSFQTESAIAGAEVFAHSLCHIESEIAYEKCN